VLSLRDDPFPFEAVRDLLGVVRAMYGAAKAAGAGRVELARIARVGGDLGRAIDLAADARPGTLAFAAAWKRAEDATRRVGDLVDALTPAEPLVVAARKRVVAAAARIPRRKRMDR
jgi:hypothetical protein